MSTKVMVHAVAATQTKYEMPCHAMDASADMDLIGGRIAKLRLTADEWTAFHRHHRPPAEWFDADEDVPFELLNGTTSA
jgi:hypothetical protein